MATVPVVGQEEFVRYLIKVVSSILGEGIIDVLDTALDNAVEIIKRFISDPQLSVLVVDRSYVRGALSLYDYF